METITFKYKFSDSEETDVKNIKTQRSNADGLTISEVCEMFEDFIESVGYSIEQVENYFKGE